MFQLVDAKISLILLFKLLKMYKKNSSSLPVLIGAMQGRPMMYRFVGQRLISSVLVSLLGMQLLWEQNGGGIMFGFYPLASS